MTWDLPCEFNVYKALGLVIPSNRMWFWSFSLCAPFHFSLFFLFCPPIHSFRTFNYFLFFSHPPLYTDTLGSTSGAQGHAELLGQHLRQCLIPGQVTRIRPKALDKAKIHCCFSFPMRFYYCTFCFIVNGHESTKGKLDMGREQSYYTKAYGCRNLCR